MIYRWIFGSILAALPLVSHAHPHDCNCDKDGMDVSQFDKRQYSVSLNIVPDVMNEDISGTPGAGIVEATAYHVQFDLFWPSSAGGLFNLAESAHEYMSIRAFSFVNAGPYEGRDYAESIEAIMFVYGRRYFLTSQEHKGFAYGWYAGIAQVHWPEEVSWLEGTPGTDTVVNTDLNETIPTVNLELLYRYQYKNILIEPAVTISFDDKNPDGVVATPGIFLGVIF